VYPVTSYESRPYVGARVDEMNGGISGHTFPGHPQNDSVKRHLDVYEVETSLNEVCTLENGADYLITDFYRWSI
jgi:hypothetical protein